MECLLEEMRIKPSIVVSDLLGASGLRIRHALAEGETDPNQLALLGDDRLKCSEEQLVDALTGRAQPMHRQMLALQRERLQLMDGQIAKLNGLIAGYEAVSRRSDLTGGSAGFRSGFGAAGDRRSGSEGQHVSPGRPNSLLGWEPVPGRMKVPKSTTAVALRKAIKISGGC
jgi:hypothetical protein